MLGCILIVITIFIHSAATRFVISVVQGKRYSKYRKLKDSNELWVAIVVLTLLLVSIIEAIIWALSYVAIHAVPEFEQALYFSIVTFTTLGYGDIVLSEKWQLLASFEVTIGIIIFGWSTAVVMAIVQKLFFKK